MSTPLTVTDDLSSDLVEPVLVLAEAARAADGVAPLSEQTLLRVRHGAPAGSSRFHVLAEEGRVVGFAFVERSEDEPDSGEVVVLPQLQAFQKDRCDRLLARCYTSLHRYPFCCFFF